MQTFFVVWCYAPIEGNGANFVYNRYMMPAWEMMKNNSLDNLGSKALDELGHTLKIKLSNPDVAAKTEELKKDITQAATDVSNQVKEAAVKELERLVNPKAGDIVSPTGKGANIKPAVSTVSDNKDQTASNAFDTAK